VRRPRRDVRPHHSAGAGGAEGGRGWACSGGSSPHQPTATPGSHRPGARRPAAGAPPVRPGLPLGAGGTRALRQVAHRPAVRGRVAAGPPATEGGSAGVYAGGVVAGAVVGAGAVHQGGALAPRAPSHTVSSVSLVAQAHGTVLAGQVVRARLAWSGGWWCR